MQTLGLDDDRIIKAPKKFWRRQFQQEPTSSQTSFDWAFGVVLPVICFFFDPIVFTSDIFGEGLLGQYRPFAYVLGFTSILTMMAWLLWRERLGWLNAFIAGLFAVGSVVALVIGVVLTPFSLLGLIILIGALGFVPFFTFVIYLRNSVRAVRAARLSVKWETLVYSAAFGAIFSYVVPFVINTEIQRSLEIVAKGSAQAIRSEGYKLRLAAPLINFEPIALRHHRTRKEDRYSEEMIAIAELYENATGEKIEKADRFLMD